MARAVGLPRKRGNAVVRYLISYSSNGLLEIQWYMFGGIVLLGLRRPAPERTRPRRPLYSWVSDRTRLWIDIFGFTIFLLPVMGYLTYLTLPFFLQSFESKEMSMNAGGLILWPAKALLPTGFILLFIQGLAELAKRIAALAGAIRIDHYEAPCSNNRTHETDLTDVFARRISRHDVQDHDPVHADRVSGRVLPGRGRPVLRHSRDQHRTFRSVIPAGPAVPFGIFQRPAAVDPLLHVYGCDLERCGLRKICLKAPASCSADPRLAYAVSSSAPFSAPSPERSQASVIAMGVISPDHDPLWLRYAARNRRYCSIRNDHAADPAFLVLIVLADQLGRSVGDIFRRDRSLDPAGRDLPALHRRHLDPAAAKNAPIGVRARADGLKLVSRVLWGMIPSIVLIFLVLGTIGLGLATPTPAGAMGAVGAMVLAAMHRRLTWPLVEQAMTSTMRLTAMVVFILIGSTCSVLCSRVDGARWIEHLLTGLPGGVVGFLIFVNIFVFFLAFFLDFFEIAFIIIPLLAPVAANSALISCGSASCSA
jgi:TRAP-type mannitol/chloroaromatic compound transport system permease small subunit